MKLTHLDLYMADKHGFLADPGLIGQALWHTGRECIYVITGFTWLGATDEWGYVHHMKDNHGPSITRPLSHLCGKRQNGAYRYSNWGEFFYYTVDVDEGNPHTSDDMYDLDRLEFMSTHTDVIVAAFTEMRNNAKAIGDTDNESYWQHELDAIMGTVPTASFETKDKDGNSNDWLDVIGKPELKDHAGRARDAGTLELNDKERVIPVENATSYDERYSDAESVDDANGPTEAEPTEDAQAIAEGFTDPFSDQKS